MHDMDVFKEFLVGIKVVFLMDNPTNRIESWNTRKILMLNSILTSMLSFINIINNNLFYELIS